METPEQNVAADSQLTETAKPPLPKTTTEPQVQPEQYAAAGESVFDVENVSIYYSAFRAVTDVSLTVHENEITAFIGPSGCGKTTVLRTLNRMNDLVAGARVEGDVRYRGASLTARTSPRSPCAGASAWSSRSRIRSRSRSMTTSPTGRASTANTTRAS